VLHRYLRVQVMASKAWIKTQLAHPVLAAETLRELMMRRTADNTSIVCELSLYHPHIIVNRSTATTDGEPSAKRKKSFTRM